MLSISRPRLVSLALLSFAFVTACSRSDPASSLGVFQVSGTLTERCAAEGLLAVPSETEFLVELKQLDTALHWLEEDRRLVGTVNHDNDFRVESYLRVDMRQDDPDGEKPDCVIERFDRRVGKLHEDGSGSCTGFSGQLNYDVIPAALSDCADLLDGPDAIADELPCVISYDINAEPYGSE